MSDEPLVVADDGLYTPKIKRHSLEKIRLHNRYAAIFATAMRPKWPQLAYIGLFAGAGRARLAASGKIVETSALAVLRQPRQFTHYIYVDRDERCTEALAHRVEALRGDAKVSILQVDAHDSATEVLNALPTFGKDRGLLCFCFVDPFGLQLQFSTIRALSARKMDFLILLMLGADWRRNLKQYLQDPESKRIEQFIDCPTWRDEYAIQPTKSIHFLLRKFDEAMQSLGYLSATQDAHTIKVYGKGVMLYMLAFYSKKTLGQQFWQDTRSSLSQQIGLGL